MYFIQILVVCMVALSSENETFEEDVVSDPNTVSEVFSTERPSIEWTGSTIIAETNTDTHLEQGLPCVHVGMCSKMTSSSDYSCYCDQICHAYGDCCVDAPDYAHALDNVTWDKAIHSQCIPMKRMSSETVGVTMVTSCPMDTSFSSCFTGNLTYPMLSPVSGYDGFIYINLACARCHEVEEYRSWEIVFRVDEGECNVTTMEVITLQDNLVEKHEQFTQYLLDKNCEYTFYESPTLFSEIPRLCFWEMVHVNDCQNYTMPMKDMESSTLFKNFDCCSKMAGNSSDLNCDPDYDNDACVFFKSRDKYQSIYLENALDNKKTSPQAISLRVRDYECKNGSAQYLYCTPVRLMNFRLPIYMELKTQMNVTEDSLIKALTVFKIYLSNTIYQIQPEDEIDYLVKPMPDFTEKSDVIKNSESSFFFYFVLRFKMMFFAKEDVKLLIDWLGNIAFEFKETIISENLTTECFIYGSTKPSDESTRMYNDTPILALDLKSGYHTSYHDKVTQRRDVPFHMCRRVTFDIKINGSDVTWAWHCDYKYWYLTRRIPREYVAGPEDILTYTCFTISCISLLLSFPLHRCSQMSKTVPGKNMENLMVTLFLSQMTFMFGIGQEEHSLCLVASIMIHYFYLSSFCWMNLCMVHIMFILSRMKKYPNQSLNSGATCRRFAPLVVVGYTLPACIVIPCVLFDFVLETDFKVGYTEHGICFPSHYPENLYVFVIPVCVSLAVNILCLLRVIFIINTAVPDGFDNTKFRRYVPVYLKLTIVSGLSWVFGIVGEATGNIFLRYCFILFTGLQGLMLCVSFVFSGSVWADVKSRVLCCSEPDPTSTIMELTTTKD